MPRGARVFMDSDQWYSLKFGFCWIAHRITFKPSTIVHRIIFKPSTILPTENSLHSSIISMSIAIIYIITEHCQYYIYMLDGVAGLLCATSFQQMFTDKHHTNPSLVYKIRFTNSCRDLSFYRVPSVLCDRTWSSLADYDDVYHSLGCPCHRLNGSPFGLPYISK